jgi:hypothetical protein
MNRLSTRIVFSILCLAAVGAHAHHSYAMFDQRQPVLIVGTLAKLELVNPHSTVWLYARKPGGKPGEYDLWAFEAATPGLMERYGFHRDSIKPGDKIAIQYFALRSGEHGGQLIRVFRADGSELIADPHALGVQKVLDMGRPDLSSFLAAPGGKP